MCDDTAKHHTNPTQPGEPAHLGQIVNDYQPLVATMVKHLVHSSRRAGVELEDLLQEANIALVELAREYAPDRGVPFGSYLKQKLKWRLVNFLTRELKRRNRTVGMDESMVEHLVAKTETLPSADVLNPRLRAALRQLSPKQRSVLYEVYWREKSTHEIARQLGVSPQSITALRRRAEEHLRQDMTE